MFPSIMAINDEVPEGIGTADEIDHRIRELCGNKSVDAFVGGWKRFAQIMKNSIH